MRQKDSLKNLGYGLLSFGVTTLMGIIIPRLFLLSYGSEVNGIISTVKQIFVYVALLEAGVGTASLQALYGTMGKSDHHKTSEILAATSHFYNRTGIVYLLAVIGLAVFFPHTVQSDVDNYVISGIILLQGLNGVVKYFCSGKLILLLKADGKTYITTNLGIVSTIISDAARIILMLAGCHVLVIQSVFAVLDVLQVCYTIWYVKKHYFWLDMKVKPDYAAIGQRNSVLIHEISGLIFHNTDTLILTYFCDFKMVSVYGMYAMFCGMVDNVIGTVSSSVTAALGQLFYADRERFNRIQEAYETAYLAIVFALYTVLGIFLTPFLKLYTEGIKDVSYIDNYLPYLFIAVHLLTYGRNTSNQIINFAGHFKQTKWRSILESCINLGVSLICVNYFGIYGVLLGTVVALLYRANDMILYANHKIMRRSAWITYRRWIWDLMLLTVCNYVAEVTLPAIEGYFTLIMLAMPTTLIVFILYALLVIATERDAVKTMWEYAKPWILKIYKK